MHLGGQDLRIHVCVCVCVRACVRARACTNRLFYANMGTLNKSEPKRGKENFAKNIHLDSMGLAAFRNLHESIFPDTFLKRSLDDRPKFAEEEVFVWFSRGARASRRGVFLASFSSLVVV